MIIMAIFDINIYIILFCSMHLVMFECAFHYLKG